MSVDNEYYDFVDRLKSRFGSFILDADNGAENKSAALRARKLSMELRKDFADFRKLSVSNDAARSNKRKDSSASVPSSVNAPGEAEAVGQVEMPDDVNV